MRHETTLLALLTIIILSATSCGTSAKRSLADDNTTHTVTYIGDMKMSLYIDDHSRSRKNADKIFSQWAENRHLMRSITGKRLLSIAPKEDGCHLTYDFRIVDGNQQRVTLIVKDYTQSYRKKHRQANSAYVNGMKYEFNH